MWTRISLSQPLRAESGEGTFTYHSGLKDGARVYGLATVSLAPEGRALEVALTHETPIGRRRGMFEAAPSWNAGHEPSRTDARVGVAYRLNWRKGSVAKRGGKPFAPCATDTATQPPHPDPGSATGPQRTPLPT